MDSWFREIHVPRAWRVYLATTFDFRIASCLFWVDRSPTLASVSYLATIKVPVRSIFFKFMFVDFSKVYVAVTYQVKPFFKPSTRSAFFSTVFLVFCFRY